MTSDFATHRPVGYGTLVAVWGALLLLTAATVYVTRLDLGGYKVAAALAIASLKGGLVIAVFMQMKYEGWLLRGLLFLALATLALFIGITFFDVLYR